jgi:hypothetical protein
LPRRLRRVRGNLALGSLYLLRLLLLVGLLGVLRGFRLGRLLARDVALLVLLGARGVGGFDLGGFLLRLLVGGFLRRLRRLLGRLRLRLLGFGLGLGLLRRLP